MNNHIAEDTFLQNIDDKMY